MPGLHNKRRAADTVVAPDVVGLPFVEAGERAITAGMALANPDADGPPIGALVWPNNPTITGQDPQPGTVGYRWDSLRVWLSSDLEPEPARKVGDPRPPSLQAEATPEGD